MHSVCSYLAQCTYRPAIAHKRLLWNKNRDEERTTTTKSNHILHIWSYELRLDQTQKSSLFTQVWLNYNPIASNQRLRIAVAAAAKRFRNVWYDKMKYHTVVCYNRSSSGISDSFKPIMKITELNQPIDRPMSQPESQLNCQFATELINLINWTWLENFWSLKRSIQSNCFIVLKREELWQRNRCLQANLPHNNPNVGGNGWRRHYTSSLTDRIESDWNNLNFLDTDFSDSHNNWLRKLSIWCNRNVNRQTFSTVHSIS